MSNIAFAQNWCNLFFINTTPGAKEKTWARLGAGISSASPEGNEEVAQDPYYDGDGMATSEVTGGQLVYTFEGNRKYGDPAQDYIASLALSYGEARKTDFLWIAPNGDRVEGNATIANIVAQGGDANAKSDFSCEIHYNGLPVFTAGNASTFPDSITASKVSVAVDGVAAINATVAPEGAAPGLVYGVEDEDIATVDAQGNIKGLKAGSTKVSIKSAVKPMVQTEIEVEVAEAAASAQSARAAAKSAS